MLKLMRSYRIIRSLIKGFLWSMFILFKYHRMLRIGYNFNVMGKLTLGSNINIGSNVKIYTNNTLGDNVVVGDNVELRCNNGNKIVIGKNCTINRNSVIIGNVDIGSNCLIAPSVFILGANHVFSDPTIPINNQGSQSKGVIIEENVWIGANTVIVDGVHISANSVIGAGSVVTKNIPKNSIAVGNPCTVIKIRQ